MRTHERTIGDHVRDRIRRSRKQIKYGANQGLPSILLIYNNLDPVFQLFGTEDFDFQAAMYGEFTALLDTNTGETSPLFQGRGDEFQESKNTSFSAVGRLADRGEKPTVTLFENVYAKVKLPFEQLPSCFAVKRTAVSKEPLSFA